MPESDRKIYRMEYQAFIKLGLVQLSFSTVESSLRIFMRALEPEAHAHATSEFKRIYDDLLLRRLTRPQPDLVELLDMASNVRHTVHNNGVYFHRSGQNAVQTYKGSSYTFEYGKPVEFTSWPLIIEITSDLIDALSDVVRNPALSAVSSDVLDPFV